VTHLGTIGSEHDPYYVRTNRFANQPSITHVLGDEVVHLEIWKTGLPDGRHRSVDHEYLPVLDNEEQHDAEVIRVGNEMIARYSGRQEATQPAQ
jgi:hypothetical protein